MNAAPRLTCAACRRPVGACHCRLVTPLRTRTRVVLLQHPRERDVPINTARIAALCLPEAEVHVGVVWEGAAALSDPARPAALLYPGPSAIDVEQEPPAGPITLVVVDGTWWQARKIIRSNPALAALPRYAIRPRAPSRYRIRAEPHEDYVSTIEALAHVLGVLEGDRARYRTMLAPFEAMVEQQLRFAAAGHSRHRRRPPRAAPNVARLPRALQARARDLVCVHGEANAWPHGSPERRRWPEALVQWTAVRVATGERFARLVVPQGPLAPATLDHLGLTAADFEGAVCRSQVLEEWSAFARASDVLCTWGSYANRLFTGAGGAPLSPNLDVRAVARGAVREHAATLETYSRHLGHVPTETTGGRGAVRIAQLTAIVRALQAR